MSRMRFILLALWTLCATASAGERALFDGRKLSEVEFRGRVWKLEKGWLEGSGETNEILGASALGEGDFVLRARVELPEKKGQNAAFVLGASRFGLDGQDGKPFVEGPLFGEQRTLLPDAARAWSAGKAFEVELRRSGEKFSVIFDKTPVFERAIGTQAIGRFGLSPGSGRIKLFRMSIDGTLVERDAPAPAANMQGAIDAAVERGLGYLVREQQRDGSWACNQRGYMTGQTALCVYTLLRSGLATDHPAVARGLAFLDQNTPEETYSAGYALMAWEATLDPQYRSRMQTVLANLIEWQRQGHWSYPDQPNDDGFTGWKGQPGNPDLSNSQYAVLGLRAAAHAGLEVSDKLWGEVIDTVLRLQEEPYNVEVALRDGATGTGKLPVAGFRYWLSAGVSASMTAAGVSVLTVARSELGSRATAKQALDCARAAELGMNWLGANFSLEENVGGDVRWRFYLLYGLERVGTLNDVQFLGTHDWYAEGSRWLLGCQSEDGSWTDARWAPDNWAHAPAPVRHLLGAALPAPRLAPGRAHRGTRAVRLAQVAARSGRASAAARERAYDDGDVRHGLQRRGARSLGRQRALGPAHRARGVRGQRQRGRERAGQSEEGLDQRGLRGAPHVHAAGLLQGQGARAGRRAG
ncbi:MAG: hypothetical protein IPJ19_14555 [Planctomycetes bacterium]|nr:hypothetical protein [Planctomycetota bacterium]